MKIRLQPITVGELTEGYTDSGDGGVLGYGGRLDIRPPYQREFVYKDKQRDAVVDTITRGLPLNVMYWADRGDGTYEVIDGQQRTISVCQYVTGDYSIDGRMFHSLTADEREAILDYELMVYVCEGTDREKLDWFETVNVAGERLTPQELRNAVYHGPWVADAKRYFSRPGEGADEISKGYHNRKVNRQELLETAIKWAAEDTGESVEEYMSRCQHHAHARALWAHFQDVIAWVDEVFPVQRVKLMRTQDWGRLYRNHGDWDLDPIDLESRIKDLLIDLDVQRHSGIYPYLLDSDERHLNLRSFPDNIRQRVYEKQEGKCAATGEALDISEMEADHITPWSKGGMTVEDNCQMVSREHNRRKGAK